MLLFPFICDTSINLNFHGSPKNKKNRTVTRFRNATHSVESPLLYRCEAKSRSSTYSFFILLCEPGSSDESQVGWKVCS